MKLHVPQPSNGKKVLKSIRFWTPVGFEIEGVFVSGICLGETDIFTNEHRAVEEDQRCEKVGLNIVGTLKCSIKPTLPRICTL